MVRERRELDKEQSMGLIVEPLSPSLTRGRSERLLQYRTIIMSETVYNVRECMEYFMPQDDERDSRRYSPT